MTNGYIAGLVTASVSVGAFMLIRDACPGDLGLVIAMIVELALINGGYMLVRHMERRKR